ncbi:4-diphosphocytidyl-2C-methyl-D-erythritol kinase [Achromobacter insolitus]|nr:4'-phosphopantetheinyl transferase superfamily protein [Achromobacter insolitus]OAE72709.1 4-diphosphocytidyl-2C-methyl-D-erythritol kinase [Achromobacter insolitus]OCZ57414.1 4-diphosphocytidyl-2C-methyl-D-erythritol kinase [Achromobacter insolitus]
MLRNSKNFQELLIWWADEGAASSYSSQDLSAEDVLRVGRLRSPKALGDWHVSRALLRSVRAAHVGGATSLSHSGGHAVCAAAPQGWTLGVDLERVRQRDVLRLAQWVCSPAEQAALIGLTGFAQLEHFYLLWTLKEAFIKAAGLDFPADMVSVGLASDGREGWCLCAPPGQWRACSYRLGQDWVASVAWHVQPGSKTLPQWRAAAACVLPPLAMLGQWATEQH